MTHLPLPEFADKVGEMIPAISREFLKYQSAEFYKAKVTLPQFIILEFLAKQGDAKMSDIARYIKVSTAAVTGLIDRLVRDGFVARASVPGDRRIVKIRLTKKGARMSGDIIEKRRQMVINIFGRLSQAERDSYLNILTRIHGYLT